MRSKRTGIPLGASNVLAAEKGRANTERHSYAATGPQSHNRALPTSVDLKDRKAQDGSVALWLPLPPANLNAKARGWKAQHFGRKRYLEAARLAILTQRGGGLKPFRNAHYAIQATFYVHQLHDWDNLAGLLKNPLDALVSVGILADDSPKHWTPDGYPKQILVPQARKRKAESPGAFLLRKRLITGHLGVKLVLTPVS